MNTFTKTTLAFAALGATVVMAPALHAQGAPAPGTSQGQGMGGMGGMGNMGGNMSGGDMGGMGSGGMGGDMAGMMKMMKMMENCNRMMQSTNTQDPSRETPPATPEQKG